MGPKIVARVLGVYYLLGGISLLLLPYSPIFWGQDFDFLQHLFSLIGGVLGVVEGILFLKMRYESLLLAWITLAIAIPYSIISSDKLNLFNSPFQLVSGLVFVLGLLYLRPHLIKKNTGNL